MSYVIYKIENVFYFTPTICGWFEGDLQNKLVIAFAFLDRCLEVKFKGE